MNNIEEVLAIAWLIGITCVLPALIVWLVMRKKTNDTNRRTEIIMAALEKNPEMDVEEWLEKLAPKSKMLKEKLLAKLVWGIILLVIGAVFIGFGIYLLCSHKGGSNDAVTSFVVGGLIASGGIALMVNFIVGKKYLAKEIEAEEKQKAGEQL